MSKVLKYKIDAYIKKLPYEDHANLIKLIPSILNIKKSTFFKWKATSIDDNFEIPEGKFQMLCQILGVQPDELRAYSIQTPPVKELLSQYQSSLEASSVKPNNQDN